MFGYRLDIVSSVTLLLLIRSAWVFEKKKKVTDNGGGIILNGSNGAVVDPIVAQDNNCNGDTVLHYARLPDSEKLSMALGCFLIAIFSLALLHPMTKKKKNRTDSSLLLKVARNTSVMMSLFLLTFCARLYSARPPTFWPISSNNTTPPFSFSEAWHVFDVMFDVSHQDFWVFQSHSLAMSALPWILLAQDVRRSLVAALLSGTIGHMISTFAHVFSDDYKSYCLRNQFLQSWDRQSGLHVLVHVLFEIPMTAYKLYFDVRH